MKSGGTQIRTQRFYKSLNSTLRFTSRDVVSGEEPDVEMFGQVYYIWDKSQLVLEVFLFFAPKDFNRPKNLVFRHKFPEHYKVGSIPPSISLDLMYSHRTSFRSSVWLTEIFSEVLRTQTPDCELNYVSEVKGMSQHSE